ncbi:hypothetical protein V496_07522 [Pseudogymnoascus sp. VKM F-4515 (FW-2607)]|nr:hypothetical protein V496_07522 [Pseudogymnoascus sp. VKM F-4515 (FW-2607)]
MTSPGPDALLQLPVEIILGIVKQLDFQPGDIGSLLGSSKTTRFILKSHEEHLSQQFTSHLYTPSSLDPILASTIPPQPILTPPSTAASQPKRTRPQKFTPPLRFPYTYPWTAEIHKRNAIFCILSTSPVLSITPPHLLSLFETSMRLCATCHLGGITAFKSHGLNTLLKLSDARVTAHAPLSEDEKTMNGDDLGRRGQEAWLAQQDALALASALALVWVASTVFEYGDRSTWGAGGCEHSGHAASATSGAPDSSDSSLVERQCIYRELALAHGPYFLWCSVRGSEAERKWVKETLDEGVEGLREYENGGSGAGMRSLQSVVLRRFAELKGCQVWEGWDEVFSCVGEEIVRCRARKGSC